MMKRSQVRRQLLALIVLILGAGFVYLTQDFQTQSPAPISDSLRGQLFGAKSATESLESLDVKGRAPKTDYKRNQFGNGWSELNGCDMRNIILKRDMVNVQVDDECKVLSGTLNDPYTGKIMNFSRGPETSQEVQIDHVVALSDAWQKGAQGLSFDDRVRLSNDPLNLLAVNGSANQTKGDGDAATWLPPNKSFRCQYVSRQIAVKMKYRLWVTDAEKQAIKNVLKGC